MKKIFALALVAMLSGCAVFSGDQVPQTSLAPYQGAEDAKQSITYSTVAMGGLGRTQKLPESGQKLLADEFQSVLDASDYFSRVSRDNQEADIQIELTVTNSGNPAALIPAFITGLSFYTIPSWATDKFDLVAKVERKDGLQKEYTLSDSTTLVQWLPMIVVFPFHNMSTIPEVRKNLYKKVLADMEQDGFFTDSGTTLSLSQ